MNLTRYDAAAAYPAPADHHGMTCVRLQGMNAGPSTALWLGVSRIEPGGRIDLGASPLEKHYVVLEGEVTIAVVDGVAATLGRWDSVRLAPGEARSVENRSGEAATLMLAMPLPPG